MLEIREQKGCRHERIEYSDGGLRFCDVCGYIGAAPQRGYQIVQQKPKTLDDNDAFLTPLFALDLDLRDAPILEKLYYRVEDAYHKSSIKGANRRCVLALCFAQYVQPKQPLEHYAKLMRVDLERVYTWVDIYHQANVDFEFKRAIKPDFSEAISPEQLRNMFSVNQRILLKKPSYYDSERPTTI